MEIYLAELGEIAELEKEVDIAFFIYLVCKQQHEHIARVFHVLFYHSWQINKD